MLMIDPFRCRGCGDELRKNEVTFCNGCKIELHQAKKFDNLDRLCEQERNGNDRNLWTK